MLSGDSVPHTTEQGTLVSARNTLTAATNMVARGNDVLNPLEFTLTSSSVPLDSGSDAPSTSSNMVIVDGDTIVDAHDVILARRLVLSAA